MAHIQPRIATELFKKITTNRKAAQKHFDCLNDYTPRMPNIFTPSPSEEDISEAGYQ